MPCAFKNDLESFFIELAQKIILVQKQKNLYFLDKNCFKNNSKRLNPDKKGNS
jgi:hypothetical protein